MSHWCLARYLPLYSYKLPPCISLEQGLSPTVCDYQIETILRLTYNIFPSYSLVLVAKALIPGQALHLLGRSL
jgi:hypothetical protein